MLLEIKGLCKAYPGPRSSKTVLQNLDFCLDRGQFCQIVGRSGSGKSTLLNIVAGITEAEEGTIQILGEDWRSLSTDQRAEFRNRHLGFIPQEAVLLRSLTSLENILLAEGLYPDESDSLGRARYLLERLGIRELEGRYPQELSGGERRRVQIARALLRSPELLIADELTGDLDPLTSEEILEDLLKLQKEGLAILLVTHELDSLRYGDQVYTMEGGQLHAGCHFWTPEGTQESGR